MSCPLNRSDPLDLSRPGDSAAGGQGKWCNLGMKLQGFRHGAPKGGHVIKVLGIRVTNLKTFCQTFLPLGFLDIRVENIINSVISSLLIFSQPHFQYCVIKSVSVISIHIESTDTMILRFTLES